jgi:hypothetical protein
MDRDTDMDMDIVHVHIFIAIILKKRKTVPSLTVYYISVTYILYIQYNEIRS